MPLRFPRNILNARRYGGSGLNPFRVPPPWAGQSGMAYWRERILFAMYLTGVGMGILFYLLMFRTLVTEGYTGLLLLNGASLLWASAVLFLGSHIRFIIRAAGALALMFSFGVVIVLDTGLPSGGLLWLFSFSVIAAMLLGFKAALVTLLANLAVLLFISSGLATHQLPWETRWVVSAPLWIALVASFVTLNAMVVACLLVLGRGLQTSLRDQAEANRSLEEDRARLRTMNEQLEREFRARQRVEHALRHSEQRYRTLLETLRDWVWEIDRNLLFTYSSPRITDVLGYAPDEVLGKTLFDFIASKEETGTRETFLRCMETGTAVSGLEHECIHRSGLRVVLETNAEPVFDSDGRVTGFRGIGRVITERKQAEEALLREKERFKVLAEESPTGIALLSPEGPCEYVNPKFVETFGYTREDVSLGREWFRMAYPDPEHRRTVIAAWIEDKARSGPGEPRPRIFQITCKNGSQRVVQFRAVLLSDGKDLLTCEDITDRIRVEEALKESEEKYRTLVENIQDGVFIIQDFRFRFANKAIGDILGYPPDDLVNMRFHELVAPEDLDLVTDRYRRRLAGEDVPKEYEFRVLRKDGRRVLVRMTVGLIQYLGQAAHMGTLVDVTQTRAAEEALRRSEKQYRDLFDSITDLIYTQDMEGRFLSVNPALGKVFAYAPEKLIGRKPSDFMKPALREAFHTEYLKHIKTRGYHQGVSVYFDQWGGKHYIEYRSVLVNPDEGEPYISGSGREVTERILAEKELKALHSQLLQAQKMEAVGTLAGGIAHDFNNLLQAISGYVELLSMNDAMDPASRHQVRQIQIAAERGRDLIQRLLTFSRKMEPVLQPMDLNQALRHILEMLERTFPKMIRIETHLSDSLSPMLGDVRQIEQVLLNLAANARDAMPEGGALVFATEPFSASENQPTGHLGMTPGGYVKLTVSDTGHGMTETTLNHVFDPFFTTKAVGKGTGLGLSMVYGIVKEHRGYLSCRSVPGKGTTFELFFPAREHTVGPQPENEAREDRFPPSGRETVLIVDDEPAVLEIAAEALERSGYKPITASNGEEALYLFANGPNEIDLVLLDLGMPGMGGLKALEHLLKLDPGAKVVVSSGYAAEDKRRESLKRGARRFISKPYHLDDLLEVIREVLDEETDFRTTHGAA